MRTVAILLAVTTTAHYSLAFETGFRADAYRSIDQPTPQPWSSPSTWNGLPSPQHHQSLLDQEMRRTSHAELNHAARDNDERPQRDPQVRVAEYQQSIPDSDVRVSGYQSPYYVPVNANAAESAAGDALTTETEFSDVQNSNLPDTTGDRRNAEPTYVQPLLPEPSSANGQNRNPDDFVTPSRTDEQYFSDQPIPTVGTDPPSINQPNPQRRSAAPPTIYSVTPRQPQNTGRPIDRRSEPAPYTETPAPPRATNAGATTAARPVEQERAIRNPLEVPQFDNTAALTEPVVTSPSNDAYRSAPPTGAHPTFSPTPVVEGQATPNGGSYFLVLLALFASIGMNLYLGWIAWDTYNRYQDLVADFRSSSSRRDRDDRDSERSYRGERRMAESGAY